MHQGARFGFTAIPAARFDPRPGTTARVSLAWWAASLDDPTPVFFGTTHAPRTVVVVWRTDHQGYVIGPDLGGWRVCEWRLTPVIFEQLQAVHQDFHLGAHDILVRGTDPVHLGPCRESLYRVVGQDHPDILEQVTATVEQVEGITRAAGRGARTGQQAMRRAPRASRP